MYSIFSLIPARRNLPFCQILSFEHKHTRCLSYYMLNHIKIKYLVTNGLMKTENNSVHPELIHCTFISLENFHFHFVFCFFCVNYRFCTLSQLSLYSFRGMGEERYWKKKNVRLELMVLAPYLLSHFDILLSKYSGFLHWFFKLIFHITLNFVNMVI